MTENNAHPVLGIFGGGQLAMMIAEAAQRLSVACIVVEPSGAHCPASRVAEVITAEFDNRGALDELIARCDVVTVELEGVPPSSLEYVATQRPVRPRAGAVAVSQDRLLEKQLFRRLGVDTAPFDAEVAPSAPAIVKTRHGGYDGRGQIRVFSSAERAAACADLPDPIVEGFVNFRRELSIVGARSLTGEVVTYPLVENTHTEGILRLTVAPAEVHPALQDEAQEILRRVVQALDYVGVIAIELFEVDAPERVCGTRLVANEMAPRVHNSGHWSQHGAAISQFELHVRCVLASLPGRRRDGDGTPWSEEIGPRTQEQLTAIVPTVMVNCIATMPTPETIKGWGSGVHAVDYAKAARPQRKVGHVNVVARPGEDRSTLVTRARSLRW